MSDSEQVHKPRARRLFIPALVLIALAATVTSVMFYTKYHNVKASTDEKNKQLVRDIGVHIALPSSDPTIVAINEKDKLANKALAARVENNDLLLIYGPEKRIIVYRPESKKVIDMLSFEGTTQKEYTR